MARPKGSRNKATVHREINSAQHSAPDVRVSLDFVGCYGRGDAPFLHECFNQKNRRYLFPAFTRSVATTKYAPHSSIAPAASCASVNFIAASTWAGLFCTAM